MNKSKIEKRQPELMPGSVQKADGLTSSPAIANTHVVCSQSPLAKDIIKFVESSSTFQVLCEETEVFVGSDGRILVKL